MWCDDCLEEPGFCSCRYERARQQRPLRRLARAATSFLHRRRDPAH